VKSLMSYFYLGQARMGIMDVDNVLEIEARDGHTSRVKALLEAGADVHADNDEALRTAAWWGRTSTVKTLLKTAWTCIAKNDGALKWATEMKHVETTQVPKDWMSTRKNSSAPASQPG
jgi:hypothetical protein